MINFKNIFQKQLTIPQAVEIFEELKWQHHPNIAEVKTLFDFQYGPISTKEELQALDLKYQALSHEPTTIEKTMTPAQLYDAGCPLWTNNYSIMELAYYLKEKTSNPKISKLDGYLTIHYIDEFVVPFMRNMRNIEVNLPNNDGYPHVAGKGLAWQSARKEP